MPSTRLIFLATLLAFSTAGATAEAIPSEPIEIDPQLRDRLAQSMAQAHPDTDIFDAEVWLRVSDQRLQRYVNAQPERLDLLHLVYREAKRQKLDPDLVLALMQIESNFDRYAISRVGAQGIMQVMPFWRLEIGRPQDNLTNLATNIRYGTVILAHYIDIAEGDLVDALARYNGSRGRLKYPEKVIGAWRKTWRNKTREDLPELQASCSNYGLKACRHQ